MLYTTEMTAAIYATAIGQAVLPLRDVAMAEARERATATVQRYLAKIEAAQWDIDEAFPYPSSRFAGRDYKKNVAMYKMARTITTVIWSNNRMNGITVVQPNEDRIAKVVEEAAEFAAAQYDTFAAKLNGKVGEHTTAALAGDHVWGYSVLTVTTPAGVQKWKTQRIWNVSKLGTEFQQWPTRLMK